MMKQAQALVGLPNALYQLSTATYGSDGCEAEPLMLTINKEFGYDQCGVLIPNTYFLPRRRVAERVRGGRPRPSTWIVRGDEFRQRRGRRR